MSARRSALWASVRELARPLVVYWVFLLGMLGAFSIAVLYDSFSTDSLTALAVFGFVTVSSVLIGQIMALLRLRDWLVWLYWGLMWTVGLAFGVFSAAAVGPAAMVIILWVILGPIFTLGGLWSLRAGRAIYATWVPLIYTTGTAIVMAEAKGKVSTWTAGSKWAVWDLFTFSVLGVAIVLLLAFLVTRESHRLHLWRQAPTAPLMGSVQESGAARPRLSCLGWAMLAALAMGLAVGTAAMGPYLWRTSPEETGEDGGGGPAEQSAAPGEGSEAPASKDPRARAREQADSVSEQIQEDLEQRVEQTIDLLSTLLILLLLLLGALLVFWRPARRLLLVRHFRRPLWSVSATTRIEQGWRLVEIAMADIGVPPRENEPAESLYRRARPKLEALSGREVHGLEEAARIRDRVAYGLGVAPGEAALMERVSGWAYDTVWDRLGDRGQLRAIYRGL